MAHGGHPIVFRNQQEREQKETRADHGSLPRIYKRNQGDKTHMGGSLYLFVPELTSSAS